MKNSNYFYQPPDYGEKHILGSSFSVSMPEDVAGALMLNHPTIYLLPFLYEVSSSGGFRRFIFDRREFEAELNEISVYKPVSDTEIAYKLDPDSCPQYNELMYVFNGTLYVRQKLLDLLGKIYQIGLACDTHSPNEFEPELIMPNVSKLEVIPTPEISKSEVIPTPANPVRGFTYEKFDDDETGELRVEGLQNAMFGNKLTKTHPYNYNKQYMDYRVYSETNPDEINTFSINLPENISEKSLTDPNCQILYHIIPVLALAPTGDLFETAVINTANRGLEFVGIQPDGTLISYGPVNVPIIMGDVDQPRGIYIPTDTPEPMRMVFKSIMNKVEERLGHVLSTRSND